MKREAGEGSGAGREGLGGLGRRVGSAAGGFIFSLIIMVAVWGVCVVAEGAGQRRGEAGGEARGVSAEVAGELRRVELSEAQALEIGRRIWRNECGGTVEGLTSWNRGEEFASLGIGHFLWYPEGRRGPFRESFPEFVRYMQEGGWWVPQWVAEAQGCPWPSREAFVRELGSARMRELREWLAGSVPQQARFLAARLEKALPEMLAAAAPAVRERVRRNFYRVAAEPLGMYALIDYVNFKGEGTSLTERYQGQGWGLLQVLEEMGDGPAMEEFARAAIRVLERRVRNSPPERGEARWMEGWRNRCMTYVR